MRTCAEMQSLPCFVSYILATISKLLNFLAHFLAQCNENRTRHENLSVLELMYKLFLGINLRNIVYNDELVEN